MESGRETGVGPIHFALTNRTGLPDSGFSLAAWRAAVTPLAFPTQMT